MSDTTSLDCGPRRHPDDLGPSSRFTTIDPIKDGYDWYAYVDHDPVNRVDLWGLDSVYATFNRAEETLSVLYLVNDDHGMLVGVERYEFDASNNVVDSYISYDSDDDGNNDYYFQPQPFPAGTWNLGVHGTVTSPDGQIHHYITTDAQDTWTTYEMIPNMRGTGNELVATGEVTTWWELWIHGGGGTDNQQFSPVGNNNFQDVTYGCLRMPNDDVPSLQRMVRAALSSPNGNAKLTVTKRD